MPEDMLEFRALIRPHLSRWDGLDLRVLGLKKAGQIENLVTHATFRFAQGEANSGCGVIDISDRLIAIRDWIPQSNVDAFLEQLIDGRIRLKDREISRTKGQMESFDLYKLRKGAPYPDTSVDPPAFQIRSSGLAFRDLLGGNWSQEVVWELRASSLPYESIADFMEDHLGFRPVMSGGGFGDMAQTIVSAPLGVWLTDDCQVTGGKVEAHVRILGGVPSAQVIVGVVGKGQGRVTFRDSKALPSEEWTSADQGWVARAAWTNSDTVSATLLLSVGSELMDFCTIRDQDLDSPNQRVAALNYLDRNLSILPDLLQGKGKDPAGDFEIAVCLLLHVCGFNAAPYALLARLSDGPDILAFAPNLPVVLVVECTTREIDAGGKLSKLQRRAKELRSVLPETQVWPMIFSPVAQAQIAKTDFDKARREEIGVVASEDIDALLLLATEGVSLRKLLRWLYALMTRTGW